jgi:hypothetical protein
MFPSISPVVIADPHEAAIIFFFPASECLFMPRRPQPAAVTATAGDIDWIGGTFF